MVEGSQVGIEQFADVCDTRFCVAEYLGEECVFVLGALRVGWHAV